MMSFLLADGEWQECRDLNFSDTGNTFWQCDSTITLQDIVMKLYRFAVEIKMKDMIEDGCSLTHDD